MAGMVEGERVGWQAQVMQLCMHMQTPRGIIAHSNAGKAVGLQASEGFPRLVLCKDGSVCPEALNNTWRI